MDYHNPQIAELYDRDNPPAHDAAFYLRLVGSSPIRVLDLGCGTGQLCCALAERGHQVTGADPAAAMLAVARRKPHAQQVEWVESSAQHYWSDRRFDLIVMTGHAFQCLLTDADILATFETMRRHLNERGTVAFETRNPRLDWAAEWASRENLTITRRDGEFISFQTSYATLTTSSTLRFPTREHVEALLASAGLAVRQVFGDWDAGPFDPARSREIIFVAGEAQRSAILGALGREEGCRRLSAQFYARVGRDPVLRPFFPGKSLRCAIEEFAAFLIQFLGGDENQTQHRWWLSLRESHDRFRIGPAARRAWLKHMAATLEAAPIDAVARHALLQFFDHSSAYITRQDPPPLEHAELADRWDRQRAIDDAVAAIAAGRDDEAIALAPRFAATPSVFTGLLARMLRSGRAALIQFVIDTVARDTSLVARRHAGRTLLHDAAAAGSLEAVTAFLRLGASPAAEDHGGHTPLYSVANECASATGPAVVRALLAAGAEVNACGGVTRATPLHMAARRGHLEIARALLEAGADPHARDRKCDTPLQRARNCRRTEVARLLQERAAATSSPRAPREAADPS